MDDDNQMISPEFLPLVYIMVQPARIFPLFCTARPGAWLLKQYWGGLSWSSESTQKNHVFCHLLRFFEIKVLKKFFQEHYLSVKQFGSRDQDGQNVGPDLGPHCLQNTVLSGTLSECQKVWSQIRMDPDVGPICLQRL